MSSGASCHSCDNLPHACANLPLACDNLPHASDNLPHHWDNLPQSCENLPQEKSAYIYQEIISSLLDWKIVSVILRNGKNGCDNLPHCCDNLPHCCDNLPHKSAHLDIVSFKYSHFFLKYVMKEYN